VILQILGLCVVLIERRSYLLLLVVVCCFWLNGCSQAPTGVHLTGQTMGTSYNVKIANVKDADFQQLQDEIDQLLIEVNKQMSTYDPNSELSLFNQWHSTEPFLLSAATLTVMAEAKRLGEMSNGVLDVTVGPLVNLWGFGPSARPEKIPSPELIDAIKTKVGLHQLTLHPDSASKLHPELYVDLSTIAKGYAVDLIAELLISKNLTNFLVEIGGEMRISGTKEGRKPWRIAIEKPVTKERAVQKIVEIGNNAIASSGDYRNYFEENGVRYSHLIDPRTGYPVKHNLVAVTVVHPSSMTADGLATALNVMGKELALALAEEHQLAVLLVTSENGEFKEYTSAKFASYIKH
jgi:thiamine biosynthesis lipoprotein